MKNQNLFKLRHSAEHVLTEAMEQLYPGILKAMGPPIENGFYFDFDASNHQISESDFEKIENRMQQIIDKNLEFTKQEISAEQAKEIFKNNQYKLELIDEIIENKQPITVYYTGDPKVKETFVDLCKGPHVQNTKKIKAFKLLSIAGAYWRGQENNKMLTRIYGTAFENSKDLRMHLKKIEDARKYDHRVLGKELDLFAFSELVGKGLVMYTPRGTHIKRKIYESLREIAESYGATEVDIPHMAKIDLYEKSGHASKFKDELFTVSSHYSEEFVLKPVNCPHHTQIYASRPRSYKDLPIRYIESTQQHRDEKPGAIGGLNRTRSFEIDDGHIFCTIDQVEQEVINLIKVIEEFYTLFGIWGKQWVSISVRDYSSPEKYIGVEEDWTKAENMLKKISDDLKLDGQIMEGEAALYGPKLDFMFKDALGNDRQLGTVQLDFAMPKRFELKYTDQNGEEKTPVMIHRAIVGSYGRFIANLLEDTRGLLPTWVSPVHVEILPVSEKFMDYSNDIKTALRSKGIRAELNQADETLNSRIRKAQTMKVPYMLIIGDQEQSSQTISIRNRNNKQSKNVQLQNFIDKLTQSINNKEIDLISNY